MTPLSYPRRLVPASALPAGGSASGTRGRSLRDRTGRPFIQTRSPSSPGVERQAGAGAPTAAAPAVQTRPQSPASRGGRQAGACAQGVPAENPEGA